MNRKTIFFAFLLLFAVVCGCAALYGGQPDDEQAVRDVISRWDAAYRSLDAKTIASLETPDFELVDRFGEWYPQTSREENERMWAFAFAEIYRGRPGPRHTVERVRFITRDVAVVQARAFWAEEITLSDGTRVPPHGQTTTFILVKLKEGWRITVQSVHNRMKDIDLNGIPPEKLPWKKKPGQNPEQ